MFYGWIPFIQQNLAPTGGIPLAAVPPDYGAFEVGGTLQQLSSTSTKSLLVDADPALFYALDFFAYLINTYPGPRLLAAAQLAQATKIVKPVAQKYPVLPQAALQENQFAFPLLCIGLRRTQTRRHTAGWESDRCSFDLLYVLPPLSPAQSELIYPILKAVYDCLRHKTTQGYDPGYTPPGGTLGQQPWALAKIESIGFGHELNEAESADYGFLEGAGNLLFPTLRMMGYIVERDMYVPAANKFSGGDIEIDLLAPDGSIAQNFMNLSTQGPPTRTSVSPNGGSITGGTSVTLQGSLFLAGPVVLFGPYKATNVTWVSASTVTCTVPSLSGPGSVSCTLLNRDGQAVTLPNAFTYS